MALNFSEKKRLLEKLPLENEFIKAKTINSFNPWFGADGGRGIQTSGVNSCLVIATPNYLAYISAVRPQKQISRFIELLIQRRQADQIQLVGQARSIARKKVLEVLEAHSLQPVKDISFSGRQTSYSVYIKNGKIRFVKD